MASGGPQASARWETVSADPVLEGSVQRLGPGNAPAGSDLRLDIPWDIFEQLVKAIASQSLGLGRMRFRRYGRPGQAQHGIDLVGRRADCEHTVVQCRQVASFTATSLRAAVEDFADGRRPFDASHFVVAVSNPDARATQVQDELAALQDQYRDEFEVDLWGPEELNDILRERADIVARFWSRETADTFCTGAPLGGVPAPEPQWTRIADQVLLSPVGVDGLNRDIAEAERLTTSDPPRRRGRRSVASPIGSSMRASLDMAM